MVTCWANFVHLIVQSRHGKSLVETIRTEALLTWGTDFSRQICSNQLFTRETNIRHWNLEERCGHSVWSSPGNDNDCLCLLTLGMERKSLRTRTCLVICIADLIRTFYSYQQWREIVSHLGQTSGERKKWCLLLLQGCPVESSRSIFTRRFNSKSWSSNWSSRWLALNQSLFENNPQCETIIRDWSASQMDSPTAVNEWISRWRRAVITSTRRWCNENSFQVRNTEATMEFNSFTVSACCQRTDIERKRRVLRLEIYHWWKERRKETIKLTLTVRWTRTHMCTVPYVD